MASLSEQQLKHWRWVVDQHTQRRYPESVVISPLDLAALLGEIEQLRAALAQEQREHANCEQFHHDGSMAKNAAMKALMDNYIELAESGDFDSAPDEIRARVRDLLNRSKPEEKDS